MFFPFYNYHNFEVLDAFHLVETIIYQNLNNITYLFLDGIIVASHLNPTLLSIIIYLFYHHTTARSQQYQKTLQYDLI